MSVTLFAQQSQTITLSLKNVPLETVFSQIKKQTGITFVYNKDILKIAGKVSVQAEKADLQTVLKQLFHNTSINFTVYGNTVVLSTKKNADSNGNIIIDSSFFSKGSVHGFVSNAGGEKLTGANVIIKRNHLGTTTNTNGEFTLGEVRTNDTLRVSFIGYDAQYVPVSSQTEFNVHLKETKNELDAVEVQAYGTTTKRLAIGEISQVSAKTIEEQPVSNPMLALKAEVPGLLITPTSGFGNAPVRVEIRGRNSIDPSSLSDPLYIIDGVPLIQSNIGLQQTGYTTGSPGLQQAGVSYSGGQSPFAMLNPNDIESITVLKDAGATAMYGSRAGNGVIIITTKRGKAGKTQVDASASQAINMVIGQYQMLNTAQYLQMRREALGNDGLSPSLATAPDMVAWDTTRYTNWQKVLYHTARNSAVRATISGGSELGTFRISGSYVAAQDVSPIATANTNKSSNINFNFNHLSSDRKFTLNLSAVYGYTSADQINIGGNFLLAPDAPSIFDSKGNLNFGAWNNANVGDSFPFGGLLQPSVSNSDFLNSSLKIGYQIIKDLNASVIVGYNLGLNSNTETYPIASQNPAWNPTGGVYLGNSRSDGWNVTPQLDYVRHIGKGKLVALIGANLNSSMATGITMVTLGYTSDEFLRSINNATYTHNYQNYSQSKYVDLHGSLNYIWEDKYIVEVSGNRDGSSNFGPGRQFGNFGVAGAGWIASEEKWLKKVLPAWVSLIKFKVSYGTTGSYPGIAYQYLSQWSNSASTPLFSYNGVVPQVPIHAVNQDYHWETDKQLNTGLDVGLLNDRIVLHAAFYQKRSDDQLSSLPTPLFTGFSTVEGNSRADVQNSGVEISVNARLIQATDFSWSAAFNFSHNQNVLLAFPGIQYTPYYSTELIGKSLNTVYLLHYTGIDRQTGQRTYQDFNGNGVLDRNYNDPPGSAGDDRVIAMDMSPKFETSLSNRINYKSLALDFMFSYRKMMAQIPYNSAGGVFDANIPLSVFNNTWKKPGDLNPNPRFTTQPATSDQYFTQSDGDYTDGSYLRLQNVAISYALPEKMAEKIGMHGIRFMVSMENVFTITKYPGIDPELPFGTQPQAKTFNGQVTFTF
ncbi:SusC/RagA family TonB-linked outer membrane protein [Mucilaginibacter sp.]|uniref:SusC/RagA family TonB-linked outer membrane protein n=1 Tax=Mucilaginibacter sp. TaxID=1882438 RepID=UPI002851D551|nr:SusC/RagA family TonB-linked outer membrane protein [Mucilaginibacter sp.]MDR3694218.1 SusC/RagA family TonB-linked outer membrane protein [Mucilaginibacter sp.]